VIGAIRSTAISIGTGLVTGTTVSELRSSRVGTIRTGCSCVIASISYITLIYAIALTIRTTGIIIRSAIIVIATNYVLICTASVGTCLVSRTT
jgi:hypothetical protein